MVAGPAAGTASRLGGAEARRPSTVLVAVTRVLTTIAGATIFLVRPVVVITFGCPRHHRR
ncbi:hypothetical protein BA062_22170 [Prauserella flavalba]|uniref:Uncharacterized protein n=1 Tax=Prauserella flavalba TaxID=1477506 RepID=A0A318LGT1_9PSEU|nr:hypothetical protein BA062_22170 [Prauserella flavalba]